MTGNILFMILFGFAYVGLLIWVFNAWEWLNSKLRLNDGYEWSKKWFVRLWALLGLALWNLFFYIIAFILITYPIFLFSGFVDWN